MLRGNYYCHLFQHTSWTTKTRHESHLEISNLLNVLSGMQFDSKRKFGGGVDCSTQKENKQTLYNNNRNNKMCATILLHDRHVASPGTSISLPFCKGHLFLFPFHHTLQDYIKPVPSEFIIDALFSSFRCQSIFSVVKNFIHRHWNADASPILCFNLVYCVLTIERRKNPKEWEQWLPISENQYFSSPWLLIIQNTSWSQRELTPM